MVSFPLLAYYSMASFAYCIIPSPSLCPVRLHQSLAILVHITVTSLNSKSLTRRKRNQRSCLWTQLGNSRKTCPSTRDWAQLKSRWLSSAEGQHCGAYALFLSRFRNEGHNGRDSREEEPRYRGYGGYDDPAFRGSMHADRDLLEMK